MQQLITKSPELRYEHFRHIGAQKNGSRAGEDLFFFYRIKIHLIKNLTSPADSFSKQFTDKPVVPSESVSAVLFPVSEGPDSARLAEGRAFLGSGDRPSKQETKLLPTSQTKLLYVPLPCPPTSTHLPHFNPAASPSLHLQGSASPPSPGSSVSTEIQLQIMVLFFLPFSF